MKSFAGRSSAVDVLLLLPDHPSEDDLRRAVALIGDDQAWWVLGTWLHSRVDIAKPWLERAYLDGDMTDVELGDIRRAQGAHGRLLEVLAAARSELIVDELRRLWVIGGAERKNIAHWAGLLATTAVVDVLLEAFRDADPWISYRAISGLDLCARKNRLDRSLVKKFYPVLLEQMRDKDRVHKDDLPALLMRLDAARASVDLLSEDIFADLRLAGRVVRVLRAFGVTIAAERLRRLYDVLMNSGDERAMSGAGDVLESLAHQRHPDTLRLADHYRRRAKKSSKFHARYAVEIWHGIDPWSAINRRGGRSMRYERLSPAQQTYFAVSTLLAENSNGGLAQYFSNSSGDHASKAHEGLLEIGAVAVAAAFADAMGVFGPRGPSRDRRTRNVQMDRLLGASEDEDDLMSAADAELSRMSDEIENHLLNFALAHRTEFLATGPRREYGV